MSADSLTSSVVGSGNGNRNVTGWPCEHNQWDNLRMRKGVMMLRCRVCGASWKVFRPAPCDNFFKVQRCPQGDLCPHPHIFKTRHSGVRKDGGVGDDDYEEECPSTPPHQVRHSSSQPHTGGSSQQSNKSVNPHNASSTPPRGGGSIQQSLQPLQPTQLISSSPPSYPQYHHHHHHHHQLHHQYVPQQQQQQGGVRARMVGASSLEILPPSALTPPDESLPNAHGGGGGHQSSNSSFNGSPKSKGDVLSPKYSHNPYNAEVLSPTTLVMKGSQNTDFLSNSFSSSLPNAGGTLPLTNTSLHMGSSALVSNIPTSPLISSVLSHALPPPSPPMSGIFQYVSYQQQPPPYSVPAGGASTQLPPPHLQHPTMLLHHPYN